MLRFSDFVRNSGCTQTYTVVIFKNAGKSAATNMMVIADLSNLSKVEIIDPVSRFVTETGLLTSDDIRLMNPEYHAPKLSFFEFSIPKLDPDQFRFLMLETIGGFPKRSNFSIKHDIFELPDKSIICITFVVVLIITILFVTIDFMLNTRKRKRDWDM